MLKYLFTGIILLYLTSVMFPGLRIEFLISILCMGVVAYTFYWINPFVRVLGLIFLSSGTIMLFTGGAGWKEFVFSFGPMLNLLSLFAIVPILALPIKLGNYAGGIQTIIARKVKNSQQLYMMTSGLAYFFSCFMNLATLPMTYYSIRPSAKLFPIQHEERFMSRAISHGFSMPLLWTPVTPIVGIVIEMTGVSWGSMLPYLVPLSIFGLALDWFLARIAFNKRYNHHYLDYKNETAAALEISNKKESTGRLFHILIAIIVFNVVISITDHLFSAGFLFLVTLLVIPFAFTWSLFIQKSKGFFKGLTEHFNCHLIKMKEQFFIFLSAGFFISAIQFSEMNHLFNLWIIELKDVIGIELFLTLLPIVPLVMAFTGLHPAVVLALMAEALDPSLLGISPKLLTISMLGGAVTSFLMGPYNATIGLLSSIVKETPFQVSNWNIVFTFIYIGFIMSFIYILQLV